MKFKYVCIVASLLLLCSFGMSQVVINSFTGNGQISWSGVSTGKVVTVQWASSPGGPWFSSWSDLSTIVTTSSVNQASVPMFYRVRQSSTDLIAGVWTDRSSNNVNSRANLFKPPTGLGRSYRSGLLVAADSSWEAVGSEWQFDYSRYDWGLQIVHPFTDGVSNGQCIIHIGANSLGMSTPVRWVDVGYSFVNTGLTHTVAYSNFFPLSTNVNYFVQSSVSAAGQVAVSFNNTLVATGMVGQVHAIDFEVKTNDTYPNMTTFDVKQFTGTNFPLVWPKGYTGIIVNPVDTGQYNRLSNVVFSPGL